MKEINRLKKGGELSKVEANDKVIIESITGIDYNNLWKKEG
jgi:hypothetical protein